MPALARFGLVATNTTGVPAAATVSFYKQGATVTNAVTVPNNTADVTITVRSVGRIVPGDILSNRLNGTPSVTVSEVQLPNTLWVYSNSNGDLVLAAEDRLIVFNNPPAVFKESTGVLAHATNQVATNGNTGDLDPAYLKEPFFDAVITGTGVTSRLLSDRVGGLEHPIYDVTDYASFQAALDVMAQVGGGGILQVPPGTFNENTTPAFTGIVVRVPSITIRGSGGTTLKLQAGSYNNTDMIRLEAGGFSLEDISLLGPNVSGTGVAIRDIGKDPANQNRAIVGHSFRRVTILSTASWGMELLPTASTGGIWDIELTNVTIYDAKSGGSLKAGWISESTVQIVCTNCDFNGPGYGTYGTGGAMTRGAVHLENCTSIAFYGCFFQPQNFSTALSMDGGNNIHIQDAHFESGISGGDVGQYWITTARAITRFLLDCNTWWNAAHTTGPRVLKTDINGQLQDAMMSNCSIGHIEASVSTDDIVLANAADGITLMNNRLFNSTTGVSREIAYTDRAGVGLLLGQAPSWQFRIPGVSGTSVVTRPTDGAMIWDATAHRLMIYENGTWKPVKTGAETGLTAVAKSVDQSQSTTSGLDISDLTVALAASEVIHFNATLIASAAAATTGIQLAINGPGSPGQVDATITGWTAAATMVTTGVNAYESYQANTTSAGTTRRVFKIEGRVINGVNAGTLALRFKSEVNLSAVTIHKGSWLQYFKGTS